MFCDGCSDHGYQLGEHAGFAKHTNFDLSLRVPLLIRAPWKIHSKGKHCSSTFVELLDLYRTLASLAEVDVPVEDTVEGHDLSSLLDNPHKVSHHHHYYY